MWQRRSLQANLGTADALVQLSLPFLIRFSMAQKRPPSPTVSLPTTARGNGGFLPLPGFDFSFDQNGQEISVVSISLVRLEENQSSGVNAVWSVILNISETGTTTNVKENVGVLREGSGMAELYQMYKGVYGRRERFPGLVQVGYAIPYIISSASSTTQWTTRAEVTTPLTTTVNVSNGTVNVIPRLVGAAISIASDYASNPAAVELVQNISARLSDLIEGQLPLICPAFSIVGQLKDSNLVPEINPLVCILRICNSQTSNLLCIYFAGVNPIHPPSSVTDLTGGTDFAYLARETVFKKTLAYCFRTTQFPTHWRTETAQEHTNDGRAVNVVVSFDYISVDLSLEPYKTMDTRLEDYINLDGTISEKVLEVTWASDGTPTPPEVSNQIIAKEVISLPQQIFFSNVGTPRPSLDPQTEMWNQALRTKVTRRFSLPFASVVSYTLIERAVNGIEKNMLTTLNIMI
jgi:hypothetical protein